MKNKTLLSTFLLFLFSVVSAWATIGGSGTPSDPYTISSTDDWNTFASNVGNGTTYQDKYVKLTADITVETMIGTSSNKFKGTFYGAGHTLTISYNVTENVCAPFRYIDGATIKFLKVSGAIVNSGKQNASIVGYSYGNSKLIGCYSDVSITSDYNGDASNAGILVHVDGGTVSIDNCAFTGKLLKKENSSNTPIKNGGLVGWTETNNSATAIISNSLFAPTELTMTGDQTLARARNTTSSLAIDNCYYTQAFGDAQGTQTSATGDDLVSLLGSGWEVKNGTAVPIMDAKNLASATVSGIKKYYSYTGNAIDINYTVTALDGTTLAKGSHFTETISPTPVKDKGEYTLTITGMGDYSGSHTFHFTVDDIPDGLLVDNDYNHTEAGYYYVNMPSSDTKILTLNDASVTTFKVYDDGGSGGNYSNNCNGTLVLTAPEGYVLRLSGSISAQIEYDWLRVYDGSTNSSAMLIDKVSGKNIYGLTNDITPVTSSGQSMRLYFYSNYGTNFGGFDLTVSLVSTSTDYNITVNNPTTGGTVVSDKSTAKTDESITLTATPTGGYLLSDVTVKDEYNNDVAVDFDFSTNIATFTMPRSAVTVTPTFTNTLTADGGLYINMPATDSKSFTIPMGVQSFKVYDDGGSGGNYSNKCNGTLVLTAPEGYVLQLSGNITAQSGWGDYLTIYDGNTTSGATLLNQVSSTSNGIETAITPVASSGQSMMLYFHSGTATNYAGLDLTVTLVSDGTEYDITVDNPLTGGFVAARASFSGIFENVTKVMANKIITLTAKPESGYLLSDVSVRDASGNAVALRWNTWTNSATFTMPASAVTVTPTFTNTLTVDGGLYINMPVTGSKEVSIPSGVRSFKVYDDGGSGSNYSNLCNGTLVLTAPEGYVLQLSGNITTELSDKLTVYDGSATSDTKLLDAVSSIGEGSETAITTVVSSGQSMMLYFESDVNINYVGLDLTVTLVSEGTEYNVTVSNPTTGGTVVSDKSIAERNETVTLTASPASGYVLSDVSVIAANSEAVALSWDTWTNTATFTMPLSAVTVTPTFTNTLTVEGGLYINMPATGSKSATIPAGVQSFKVYDDGGSGSSYSNLCNGYLVLTAPEGYVLQLSGYITTEPYDKLTVYDGSATSDTKLLDAVSSTGEGSETAITTVVSSGQSMMLYFESDVNINYVGLDLTVTLVPITYTVCFFKNNDDATGSMDAQTHTFDAKLALTANSFEYMGYAFAGWATTIDGDVVYADKQIVSNLATTLGANIDFYAQWKKSLENSDITVAGIADQTYTGSAICPDVVVKDGETPLEADVDYTVECSDNVSVGQAKMTITGMGNYGGSISKTFKITPKEITVSWDKQTSFVYNGMEHAPTATLEGVLEGDVCELTVTGAEKNAGKYTATATKLSNANYKLPATDLEQAFEIVKADPTIVMAPVAVENLVYNGKAQTLVTAGEAKNGVMVYKLEGAEKYSETLPTATEVGDYTVYFMVQGNENYNDLKAQTLTATIAAPASSSSVAESSSSVEESSSSVEIASSSSSSRNDNESSSSRNDVSSSSVLASSSSKNDVMESSSSSVIVSSSSNVQTSSSSVVKSSSSSVVIASNSSSSRNDVESSSSRNDVESSSSRNDVESSSSRNDKSSSSSHKGKSSSSSKEKKDGFAPIVASGLNVQFVRNELTVTVPTASEVKVYVFDLQGNLKKQYHGHSAGTHNVSLNQMNRGLYLVRVVSGSNVRTLRAQVK